MNCNFTETYQMNVVVIVHILNIYNLVIGVFYQAHHSDCINIFVQQHFILASVGRQYSCQYSITEVALSFISPCLFTAQLTS